MINLDDVLPNSGVVVGLTTLLPLLLLLPSCEEPPDPGKPVLQIRGTKPPSIDLSLRLRYEATTEQRQCQTFSTLNGYRPVRPAWYVWTHEPPSGETDERYRIVPMDTTGSLPDSLKGKDLEHFRWTVNAGWAGSPSGCDFNLIGIGFFNTKKTNLKQKTYGASDFHIREDKNKCPKKYIKKNMTYESIYVVCSNGEKSTRKSMECEMERRNSIAYCLERPFSDTIDISINVKYSRKH